MANPIHANPASAVRRLTIGGSDWLWVVFTIMVLSAVMVFVWAKLQPRGTRAFHYLAVVILTVSSLSYFAMASDLGQTSVRTEFRRGATRSIFWVRYIQWFINAPLILLMLLLTTGLPLSDLFLTLFMILVTVVMGLVGALTPSSYKWGFFVFGVTTLFYVLYAGHKGGWITPLANKTVYSFAAGYTAFIWLIYPICWGLSEGSNAITVTSEMIFYGILDLFAGPIFLFGFLLGIQGLEYDTLGLQSGKASDYVGVPARPTEKAAEAGAAA
ncbi:family A G protein-coupled receptor-like protein [Russula emetica]|nr:family A G protein-coupled receptor-like protein [Russula emetica]